jgi:sporulation protein YlmC with PRC-barrel domain
VRLELDRPVLCEDEEVGQLADLVVDPVAKRVTHLVVKPKHDLGESISCPSRSSIRRSKSAGSR